MEDTKQEGRKAINRERQSEIEKEALEKEKQSTLQRKAVEGKQQRKELTGFFKKYAAKAGKYVKKKVKERVAEEKELWRYRRVARIQARKQLIKQGYAQKYFPKKQQQQTFFQRRSLLGGDNSSSNKKSIFDRDDSSNNRRRLI